MHDQTAPTSSDRRDANSGQSASAAKGYPIGRGYGHDLMRGGEVFGGYGYADRPEYSMRRGDREASG
jgi:hypothetical protein